MTKLEPTPRLRGRRQKVQQRLAVLECALDAHDSNIALLKAFNAGHVCLKGKGYTHSAEHYQPTLQDKQRLPRTLANLNAQRALLQFEIEVLREYGA